MKKSLMLPYFLSIAFSIFASPIDIENKQNNILIDSSAITDSNNAFAFTVYEYLRKSKESFVFSPYNIYSNLALLTQGAGGETLIQFTRFLHFPLEQKDIPALFSTLNHNLSPSSTQHDSLFYNYNNVWIDKQFQLKDDYLSLVTKSFNSVVDKVDFKDKSAFSKINSVIEKQTQGKITDFFTPSSLDSRTKAVIASTLYFKGLWKNSFDPLKTTPILFSTEDNTSVEYPMMQNQNTYNYTETADFTLLELPYMTSDPEKEFALYIFLPKTKDGLKSFEEAFSISQFLEVKNTLQPREVKVVLPKFIAEKRLNIATLLKNLGLRIPFTPFADFSRMTTAKDLYINQLESQVTLEVNEEGTEATAATGGTFVPTSVLISEIFKADHPFVYLLVEKKSQLIIFMGRFIK